MLDWPCCPDSSVGVVLGHCSLHVVLFLVNDILPWHSITFCFCIQGFLSLAALFCKSLLMLSGGIESMCNEKLA